MDPREHPDFGWAWITRFLVNLGNSLGTLDWRTDPQNLPAGVAASPWPGACSAEDNSGWFGLNTVLPRYSKKCRAFGSTTTLCTLVKTMLGPQKTSSSSVTLS